MKYILGIAIFILLLMFSKKLMRCENMRDGYVKKNFTTLSTDYSNLAGQPMSGTLDDCMDYCNYYKNCVGFTRQKLSPNRISDLCWLKKNLDNPIFNNWKYQTFVKQQK